MNSTLQFVSILAEHAVQAVPAFLLQALGTDDTVGVVIGDLHEIGDGACLCLWRRAGGTDSPKAALPPLSFSQAQYTADGFCSRLVSVRRR